MTAQISRGQLAEAVAALPVNWDADVTHSWCCDPNVSYCGTDVSGAVEVGEFEGDADCPFCDLMEDAACPRGCNVQRAEP